MAHSPAFTEQETATPGYVNRDLNAFIRGSKAVKSGGKNQQAAPHPVPRLVSSLPHKNGDSAGTDGNRWSVRSAPPDIRAWQRETFCWGSGHGSSLTFDLFQACRCLPGSSCQFFLLIARTLAANINSSPLSPLSRSRSRSRSAGPGNARR